MAILAALLLALGIPQLARTIGRLSAGLDAPPVTDPALLRRSAEQAEALDATLADPRGSLQAGLQRLRLALPAGQQPDRAELEKAAGDLESGLSRGPADGQAWAALGHADLALGRDEAAARALAAGLFAAQADPYLNPSWCVLGIALWRRLDQAAQARIAEEVRWAWRDRRQLIVTMGSASPADAGLLRDALFPEERAEFDRRIQAAGGP